MKSILCVSFLVLLFAAGCSSSSPHMVAVAPDEVVETVAPDQSAIVFMRPTSLGYAIQAPVAEVDGTDVSFVAIVSAYTKVMYVTTPGQHKFVVGGEGSGAMEATLEPGKIYYAKVEPFMGMWKARFEIIPIRPMELTQESFRKDLGASTWMKPGPTAQSWHQENLPSMREKARDALSDSKIHIMLPEFGVDQPVTPILKSQQ